MSKILGLDLGTNSLGWAIRDTDVGPGLEQITHKGVVIFQKGVGENKGIEFSLAAGKTRLKAARKRNQRKRWRKIDLLTLLINNKFCPLDLEELKQWKEPARKHDRIYPQSPHFKSWLRLDFNNDGLPDFPNPFDLRAQALVRQLSPEEIGRICYHLTQRRGYLSNRNDKASEFQDQDPDQEDENNTQQQQRQGKVATAISELEEKLAGRTIGQQMAQEISTGGRARRRKEENTNINRLTLQAEFLQIATYQQINPGLTEKIRKVIFDQRPLKSQKGIVGKCMYEKDKSRCPISHPEFELCRMWQSLNNIKYSDDQGKTWYPLHSPERVLAQQKFFRRSSPAFPFADISKALKRQHPDRIFNYKDNQTLSGCPTLSGFIALLGEEKVWELRNQALQRLHWEENEKRQSTSKYPGKQLDLYDLWHWLFQMDNDKDQQIVSRNAARELHLSEKEAASFVHIPIRQGYGSLSLKAIRKINYWLQKEQRYDKAVFLANIPHIAGQQRWESQQAELLTIVQNEMTQITRQKTITDIVNSLISRYNNLPYNQRFARSTPDYQLDSDDLNDVNNAILNYIGPGRWEQLPEEEQYLYQQDTGTLYEMALQKSSSGELSFVKPPRLETNLRIALGAALSIHPEDKVLDKLYHPSETEFFPPALSESGHTGRKLLNTPRTDSIRNPMAMRTLHELRKLTNHLIKNDLIDEHTHVLVEVARELNDANRRQAIERYQREREAENQKYAAEIEKIFREQNRTLPEDLTAYVDRYRLREEQPLHVCLYTGKTISNSDLFDEFTTDVEHTLPRSLSFDDSLQNKTIAFKFYNNEIKNKLLPSQLPNYTEEAHGYSPIQPRLQDWNDTIARYQTRIDIASRKSRLATTKEVKDKAIQERHYCILHQRYWKNKLDRFTIDSISDGFKNSQLIDTQIIAKYGVLYLKTLFLHVRSTKGVITDKIKRIWGAMSNDEKKDRSRHSHHTLDAIIQTLLHKERNKPDIYNLLAASYLQAEQNKWKEPQLPNPWGLDPAGFYTAMRQLSSEVIVYHADRDNVLKQTKKKVRSNGSIVYSDKSPDKDSSNPANHKQPQYQKGRGIRASLHKDTFYGAIKVPLQENGKFTTGSDGHLLLQKDEKGEDLLKFRTGFVFRGNTLDAIRKAIENIVDDRLRQLARETGAAIIQNQGYFEIPPSEQRKKKDPLAQATKVYKVKVFAENLQNPLKIKQHIDSRHEHKKWYYVQTDGNYLMALYSDGVNRDFELINTYELAGLAGDGQGLYPLSKNKSVRGKNITLSIDRRNKKDIVLKKGTKVLLYETSTSEITADITHQNLSDRLYKVNGLSIQRQKTGGKNYDFGIIILIHHAEARPIGQLKMQDGAYQFGDNKSYRKLNHNQFNALVEEIDFRISPQGAIHLISPVNE